jgi:hypothetical protein
MWNKLKVVHTNIKAAVVRWFRAREVVKVMRVDHAQQLAECYRTNPTNAVLLKAQQSREIAAVKSGQFGIIDRRSWQFPYIPEALHRLNQPILKNTPYNLRRFSETPIPRKAINLIKDGLLSLRWRVSPDEGQDQEDPELLKECEIATYCLKNPNNQDSYRTFMEAVAEDFIIGGYGTIEPQLTPDYRRPFKMWPIDGTTIRIYADWTESAPDRPHYAQLTGLKGERGIIAFMDDEIIYVRDNVRSSTPFGLGKLEVCFNTVNAFLGVQDMASKAGADQIHKTWLWWKESVPPAHLDTVRRHIRDEVEGQSKMSLMSSLPVPSVLDVQAVTPEDLLLEWQEFLIRIIAAGFGLSAMALGLERDVNRNTAEVMSVADFNATVVPVARRFEEAITRFVLHRFMGWKKLRFEYMGLEDPDAMTQMQIMTMKYRANATTPDEIREAFGDAPLPGGWGKLTMAQQQLLIASVAGGKSGSMGGMAVGGSSGGMGGGMGGGGSISSAASKMLPPSDDDQQNEQDAQQQSGINLDQSPFSADEVAQMSPDDIMLYQQAGLLPGNNGDLMDQMNQQSPGILETLSDQLVDFFTKMDEQTEEDQTKPAKITKADQTNQVKMFRERQHRNTQVEQDARRIELQRKQLLTRNPFRGTTTISNRRPLSPRSGGDDERFRGR